MTEQQLVEGCVAEDPVAQRTLFERYSSKMYGVCVRYARDRDAAQDILQDGFVKVFEKIGSFKQEGSFEGWMRRIFVNTALDAVRKNKNMKNSMDIDEVDFMLPQRELVTGKIAADELLQLLHEVPIGYRTVFNLFAIEGYSHKEIAEALDISVNTSKSQYSRAKEYIKKLLEENGIEY